MIIQTAPPNEKRFISSMVQHLGLCDQYVRAFGNEEFDRPEPYAEMVYIVSHHDRGWDEFDANPVLDETSGLPCGIGSGPVPNVVTTSRRSPDFNESRHAYCGLLSSMHSWGLYNERYGLTQFRVLDGGKSVPIPPGEEGTVKGLLDGELARQERLKAELGANPETAGWVEERRLFRNYKLLQFFDTLALYFNLRHASEHAEEVFVHVPKSDTVDVDVTLRPIGNGRYTLSPFPFAGDRLETHSEGRYFAARGKGEGQDELAAALYAQPVEEQVFVLEAA